MFKADVVLASPVGVGFGGQYMKLDCKVKVHTAGTVDEILIDSHCS